MPYQNVHGYIDFIVLLKLKASKNATFLKAVRKARDSAVFVSIALVMNRQ